MLALMVELAYTADLKSAAARLVGSSPTGGTCEKGLCIPLLIRMQGPLSFLNAT